MGNYPIGIAVDDNTGRVYIQNNRGNTLSILDGQRLRIIGTLRTPQNVSSLAIDPGAGLLMLALKSADRVGIFPLK